MNVISLIAWEDRQSNFIFVYDPSSRGRYLRTDRSVVNVSCSQCNATIGEPCFVIRDGLKHYYSTTHAVRRHMMKRGNSLITKDVIVENYNESEGG